MKLLLSYLLFFLTIIANGQTVAENIAPIITIAQAKVFVATHPEMKSDIWTITPELEKEELDALFLGKKVGDIFSDNENTYKVLASNTVKAFRVSYIYLDGSSQ